MSEKDIGGFGPVVIPRGAPFVMNGKVHVHRYHVVQVDEPTTVIVGRIQLLWERSENIHEWEPLRDAARAYGVTLDPAMRGKRKEKRT